MYLTICVLFVLCKSTTALPVEPVCSAFDFELKTLETMLRTEHRVEKLMGDNRAKHESMAEEFKQFKLKMTTEFEELKTRKEEQLLKETEKLELLTTQTETRLQSVDNALELLANKSNDQSVAFSVTHPTKSFADGVPTIRKSITNAGNGYNMDTGVFTAPVDGLYLFVLAVTSINKNKYDLYCWIQQNGSDKACGITSGENLYTSSSISVNIVLTKGDNVTLGSCSGWEFVDLYTYFSGALIK